MRAINDLSQHIARTIKNQSLCIIGLIQLQIKVSWNFKQVTYPYPISSISPLNSTPFDFNSATVSFIVGLLGYRSKLSFHPHLVVLLAKRVLLFLLFTCLCQRIIFQAFKNPKLQGLICFVCGCF